MEMIRNMVIDPIRESMLSHDGSTSNSRNYKKTLKPEDLRTAIAAIPEVTPGLRAYDWSLLEKVLAEDSPKLQAAGRPHRRLTILSMVSRLDPSSIGTEYQAHVAAPRRDAQRLGLPAAIEAAPRVTYRAMCLIGISPRGEPAITLNSGHHLSSPYRGRPG